MLSGIGMFSRKLQCLITNLFIFPLNRLSQEKSFKNPREADWLNYIGLVDFRQGLVNYLNSVRNFKRRRKNLWSKLWDAFNELLRNYQNSYSSYFVDPETHIYCSIVKSVHIITENISEYFLDSHFSRRLTVTFSIHNIRKTQEIIR